MNSIDGYATIISAAAVVVSLVFVGWQSRELAKQTRTSNAIAATTAVTSTFDQLHRVLNHLIDDPGLWPYFYAGEQIPLREAKRRRVLVVAEKMADVLDAGLLATTLLPTTETYDDWVAYSRFLAEHSPVMVYVINLYEPPWWPRLLSIFPITQKSTQARRRQPRGAPRSSG
jgi:hypothetical protein